jgi:hypothetical protein
MSWDATTFFGCCFDVTPPYHTLGSLLLFYCFQQDVAAKSISFKAMRKGQAYKYNRDMNFWHRRQCHCDDHEKHHRVLLEISAHHILNVGTENQLRIKFIIVLFFHLRPAHTSADLGSDSGQEHFRHAAVAFGSPGRRRFGLQELRNGFFRDVVVPIKSLGHGKVHEDAGELVARVVGEFKGNREALAEVGLEGQKGIDFEGKAGQDDEGEGIVRLADGRVHAAGDFVERIEAGIAAVPLGGHAEGKGFVDKEDASAGFVEDFARLENGGFLVAGDQVHAFDFEEFGFAQES